MCVQEWAGVREIREVLVVLNPSSREEGNHDEKKSWVLSIHATKKEWFVGGAEPAFPKRSAQWRSQAIRRNPAPVFEEAL